MFLRTALQKLEMLRMLKDFPDPAISEEQRDVMRAAFALCSKVGLLGQLEALHQLQVPHA